MPTFGDFETYGEPLAVTDDHGHLSTVWRARRSGGQGDPNFAIKLYAPVRRRTVESQPDAPLESDPSHEYLESVKQLKKAQGDGAPGLCPVHAFGFADEGAWFVTDCYNRGALKVWIARRGGVDSAALRHVVRSVVAACLGLKRSRGFSHGNLKPSNILLVGKPSPLRQTPLCLMDAHPAATLRNSQLAQGDRETVGGLWRQAIEVQDLHSLGELLLQLVEGRLLASIYDYDYPVSPSPAWERLGKDGERWRDLCNRLLDPRLSLDKLSLESLAAEIGSDRGAGRGKLLKVAAVIGLVLLLTIGIILVPWVTKKLHPEPPNPSPVNPPTVNQPPVSQPPVTPPTFNKPPVASSQTLVVTAGEPRNLILGGSDPEKATLTYLVVEQPKQGRLSGTAPTLIYTTEQKASGSDSFKFKVSDGVKESEAATVSITINAFNQPPTASDQTLVLTAGEPRNIILGGSDPEKATLTYRVVEQPKQGKLSGTPPTLIYTTVQKASGSDSFKFKVSDGVKESEAATVSITINAFNQPPTASDQTLVLTAGEPRNIILGGSDPEKATLTYRVVEQPKQGKLSGTPPTLIYTTVQKASGSDSFKFKVSDGVKESEAATVSITINAFNQPPTASDQTLVLMAGEPRNIILGGSDPEKATLTYRVVEQPKQGKLSGTPPTLIYTTVQKASGSDSFKFKVSDGVKESEAATVSITINAFNQPPTASDQTLVLMAGEPGTIILGGSDPEKATLTYRVVEQPKQGKLSGTPPTLIYTTEQKASGNDSFKFKVSDGVKESEAATVSITINAFNQPPTASDQTLVVTAGEPGNITLGGSDPEKATLTYRVVEQPKQGRLNGTAPTLIYTTEQTASGSDSFKFKVNDGVKESEPATVSITINSFNQPPTASGQSLVVTAGESRNIILGGSDPEKATLTYLVVEQPKQGNLSGTPPMLIYTTEQTASGTDSFKFKVSDGVKDSEPATVSVIIKNEFRLAIEAGWRALSTNNITEAEAQLNKSLTWRSNDPEAKQLKDSIAKARKLKAIDVELEILFVRFNVLKASSPAIKSPEARKEVSLTDLGAQDQKQYMKRVLELEETCDPAWLDQNNRRLNLQKLKEKIRAW